MNTESVLSGMQIFARANNVFIFQVDIIMEME